MIRRARCTTPALMCLEFVPGEKMASIYGEVMVRITLLTQVRKKRKIHFLQALNPAPRDWESSTLSIRPLPRTKFSINAQTAVYLSFLFFLTCVNRVILSPGGLKFPNSIWAVNPPILAPFLMGRCSSETQAFANYEGFPI